MTTSDEHRAGKSLPWFRVDVDMVDHPKTHALAMRLDDECAGWYVIQLWAWTMRYAPRGRLAVGAETAIERTCRWRGEPGALIKALIEAGWLTPVDGALEVHDWDEHQGAAVAKAQKDAARKRERRAERGDGAGTARAGRGDGAGDGTGRDETERDQQQPSSGQPDLLVVEASQRTNPEEEKLTDAEFQVFEHWRRTRHPHAKASRERQRLIAKALKLYSVEELQLAIDGVSRSPHHMGDNKTHTVYDDIDVILRNSKQIEHFISLAKGPA